ncbi:sugar-phosphate isomerase, RpiB/LacA/LacB family [Longilinea arvoryzae]|uniref:Sugar-phosphate isomerase, RpiB/LacA/LacB family n=1 Tax=Longilinea arvoryzae TaxID=360412 RepID=A0A0S7BNK4_9CHLR|nr:RpiB/LacA/LacB family sugar-phosphate isomerase [Longilinea arvoryzae]GAP15569.1 sugar-phosphate isomerase, RpiB/LacA/LacB family [Longilinea arvoryzae]
MRLSVGADERKPVVDAVLKLLKRDGHRVIFYGPTGRSSVPWPEVAACVAHDVAGGAADEGILFCWTGTGVSMAANKVPGIRAALCGDAETARGARQWNDANLLCLSLRTTTEALAQEIIEAWFTTQYRPTPEDEACLAVLRRLEYEASHPEEVPEHRCEGEGTPQETQTK